MLQPRTFRQLLSAADEQFTDRYFFINDPLLGPVRYADVLRFSYGLEYQLDRLGVAPGAAVATQFHNCGLAALLFLATIAARRVLVPLNPLCTGYELEYVLDRSRCVAMITDPAHRKCAEYGGRSVIEVPDHRDYFAKLCATGSDGDARRSPDGETHGSDAFAGEIVFTSGSTGRPKGVLLSEASLLADALALAQVYDLRSEDRFLTVCPLFHNSGQLFTTLACALVGGSTAAVKSDIGMLHFWSYVEKFRAQWSLGMNSFLALLLAGTEEPTRPTSMRALLTGGSAIDGSLVQKFETRFGVPVRTVYGLTETASISTCEHLDPSPRSLGSSGRPLPICKVKIDSGESLSSEAVIANRQGEILISGNNLFECYVSDPELTQSRKDGDWLRTGDIGYFDENGNLFVVDRVDSMLIVGGENVYPAEVEILRTYLPDAAEIVLAGVDHPIWGTELVLIYRTSSSAPAPIALWHRLLAERLAPAKIPQRYVSVRDLGLDNFPRKENGKLDRQATVSLLRARLPGLLAASA